MAKRVSFKSGTLNGPLLGLASLLVIGFVVGLLAGWIWARVGQDGLREDDYLVMVALLYDRDRSLPTAQERLAMLDDSDVARNVAALAESYPKNHPEAQIEARAMRQLAAGLTKSPIDAASKTGERAGESGGGGIWIWLGIILLLVIFLGIAGPFALRFATNRRGRGVMPFWRGGRRNSIILDTRAIKRPTIVPSRGSTSLRGERNVLNDPPRSPLDRREMRGRSMGFLRHGDARSIGEAGLAAGAVTAEGNTPAREIERIRFESNYRFGDDPFDEVHPLMGPDSGEQVGACGFSAELKVADDYPGRYYAFSVWAHDAGNEGSLKSIAIVSKWAKSKAPPALVKWVEQRRPDDVVVANPGMRLMLDTFNMSIDVNIASFRYANDAETPAETYFSNMIVAFEVKIK